MKEQKIETWIKAGYKLLATEGVEGLKVERVAYALDLNKSGFYYYFGDMEHYLKCLLEHHVALAKAIGEEIKECIVIDPDLFELIVRHKRFFLVESQLLSNIKSAHYPDDFKQAGEIINQEFLPLFKKFSKLPVDSIVAQDYLNLLLRSFYARINPDNFNARYFRKLTLETMTILNQVAKERYVLSQHEILAQPLAPK